MKLNPSGAPLLCLMAFATSACAGGVPAEPSAPIIRYVEVRPQMTAAQAADPEGCAPPVAQDNIGIVAEDQVCAAQAETLADWIRSLQTLLRGPSAQ